MNRTDEGIMIHSINVIEERINDPGTPVHRRLHFSRREPAFLK